MTHVRIVLIDLPQILGDIVRTVLEEQREVTVVAESLGQDDLYETLAATSVQLVVWGLDCADDQVTELPDICRDLLERYPSMKVLAIQEGGRSGYLWELQPRGVTLGELSPRRLVQVINELFG